MKQPPLCSWLLVGAVAIAAMASGHAVALALGGPDGYRHAAQGPFIGIAAFCAFAGIALVLRRIEASARTSAALDADWVLPALASIERLGPGRLIPAVVCIQLAALFAGECLEQRMAGVSLVGVQALFGSSLAVVPFVHVAIGTFAAALLWQAARAVCRNAGAAVAFVLRVLALLARSHPAVTASRAASGERPTGRRLLPLAYKIASRPPPFSFIRTA